MGSEPVIEIRDVWRQYRLAPAEGRTTLRASLAHGRRGVRRGWFWALRGVDLTVHGGGALAIVGSNGAGKSTLLRLAGGVGRPDRGSVRVEGRVGALLDLGRELHPDLTGRQNAELAAVVAGLSRAEFARRADEIIDFAGLAGFIDQPLHAYSDGMRARLAFSVLAHVDPDVLLVDEVLAVGDAAFQRRSLERIERLRGHGTTVVFVSHDLSLVRQACDEAAWLDAGAVRMIGPSDEVVAAYLDATTGSGTGTASLERADGEAPVAARLLDQWGVPASALRVGDGALVEVLVDTPSDADAFHVSVQLRRAGAVSVAVDTSTSCRGGPHALHVAFDRLDLAPGRYALTVSAFSSDWRRRLGHQGCEIDVIGDGPAQASLAPPHEWRRIATQ